MPQSVSALAGRFAPKDPDSNLRPYQRRDYRDVLPLCEKVRRVLYVAFMGSGKTVEAAALIRTWVARGERVLILTHTREILRQTDEKLLAAGLEEDQIGWIWRDHPRTKAGAPIQLASLDTLIRRDLPKKIARIVVDEAHHAVAKKWLKVLSAYPKARVLGLTGTPVRLDGLPLGDVFDEMYQSDPVETLIEAKWIDRPEFWTPEWAVPLPRKSGQDFSTPEADRMMKGTPILGAMVTEYRKHGARRSAIGFAATKEKASLYAKTFADAGIPADTLFGTDTDLRRQATLSRLRRGKLRVVWTCDVLNEGWDYPGLRCVMLARPTLSLARYLQQVARCMRPGNVPPVVLDLWGAWRVFAPPWADHGWDLHAKPRPSIHIGKRTREGSVEWTPPIEVDGKLVRADFTKRQTVCAGFKGEPCPKKAVPASNMLGAYYARKRRNEPWRCRMCFQWNRSPTPVEYLKQVDQKTCAGWAGHVCVKRVPYGELCPAHQAKRKGAPWRCPVCVRRHRSPYASSPFYVDSHQKICPGFNGQPCPNKAVPSKQALAPSANYHRQGEPWRCDRCGRKVGASKVERTIAARERRAQMQMKCPGWRGSCPKDAIRPENAMTLRAVRHLEGKSWRCRTCTYRRRMDLARWNEVTKRSS